MTMAETLTPLSPQLDTREQRIHADYEWVLRDADVQRQYAGQVVAVYNRTIWGHAPTHLAALENALSRPGCPAAGELVTVPVEGQPAGA
jgi:hypothetical protein